jgi:perosamine synthetase
VVSKKRSFRQTGAQMRGKFLGYGRQTIDDSDIDAVVATLRGDFLTQGPTIPAFEKAIADYVGARHAIAVSSGTAALHVACLAAGATRGTLGVTQPLTFVASANCLAYCGAEVDLVEIDSVTLTMDVGELARWIERRPETSVVVPVSFSGLSSNISEIKRIAGLNRVVIEDACHAFGAERQDGSKVGAPGGADMTVFSFHPVKPITTAEGGAVVTDDDELARRVRLFSSHGIVRDPAHFECPEENQGSWYYEQQVLGFNYRLTELQAALGLAQLRRIDTFIARRRQIALIYDRQLAGVQHVQRVLNSPAQRKRSGHHLYIIDIDYAAAGRTRREVMMHLHAEGVGSQVHYIPVYRHPYWHSPNVDPGSRFPVSERFYKGCLSLPCFPSLVGRHTPRSTRSWLPSQTLWW